MLRRQSVEGEPVVPGHLGHLVGPRGHVAAGGSGVVILVQEHPRQLIASAATTLAYRSSRRRSSTTKSGSRPGSRIPSCSASPAICAAVPVSEFVLGPESGTRLAVSALLSSPFVPVRRREAKCFGSLSSCVVLSARRACLPAPSGSLCARAATRRDPQRLGNAAVSSAGGTETRCRPGTERPSP